MKWQIKNMVDPGDGLVTTTVIEHQSDDIVEVGADCMNGDVVDSDGEGIIFHGWIMSISAVPS